MSSLQPIESIALGERTFDSLRRAMIQGDLARGEPLHDRQLAELLHVSRTPVREALKRLEDAGLVEPRGRSGWEGTPFTEQDVREVFRMRVRHRPPQFSDQPSPPTPADPRLEYSSRDHAFHSLIVSCSRNRRIMKTYGVM